MKTIRLISPVILILIFLFPVVLSLSAQECGDCPKRSVMLYDLDVQVPRPGEPAQIIQWQNLFWASYTAENAAFNDATSRCLYYYEGTLIGRDGRIPDTAVFGLGYTHTAPQGEIAGYDYLISGSITGSEGAYGITISLETVCSRETVTSGSTVFSSASQAADVGTSLGTQVFSNIATTIEQFEVNKRNANTDVARDVQDRQMVITPSKTKAARGESVPVQISLVDCDGIPLANRTITLTASQFHGLILNGSENGAFTEQTITTDANGIAHPNFITGASPGIAILRAYFVYKNPMGCDRVAGASATILIGDPKPDGYVIEARLSYLRTITYKYSGALPIPICSYYGSDSQNSILKKNLTMTAICKNTGGQDAEGVIELASSSIAVQGSKDERDETTSYQAGKCTGMPFGERRHYDLWLRGGPVISGFDDDGHPLSWVTFIYNPDDPGTSLFGLTVSGSIMERVRENSWTYATPANPGDKSFFTTISDTTEFSYAAITESVFPDVGGTIKVVGSGFEIDLEQDESKDEPGDGKGLSLIHMREILSVHATVRPLSEYIKP